MSIPGEFFEKELTAVEFKTAIALYSRADSRLQVEISTEDLATLTGYSQESLRRAFRGLEAAGILETTRTKRDFGKWSKNKYQLVLPSHKAVGSEPEPSHKAVGSTGGHVVPPSSITISKPVTSNTNLRSTSYFLVRTGGAHMGKEIVVPKWNPDEDEGLAGFGLFEEDVQAKEAKLAPKVSKRDPWTRNQRPMEQWTTADVAAEFSHQMWLRFPKSVTLVNRQRLAGALRGYRSKYDTNATIEMELLKMFFEDDRNLRDAEKYPEKIHGWYLNMFKSHMTRALERLGMESTQRLLNSQLESDKVTSSAVEEIFASDGTPFDNSLIGRRALEQYEKQMRETT